MKIKCNKCNHIWEYKGKRKPNKDYVIWISCSNCKTSTRLIEYFAERVCFICGNIFKTEDMKEIKINGKIKKYICIGCLNRQINLRKGG